MTEEIIIDGVDVSGCEFLVKKDDYCSYSGEYRAYKGQCGCSDEEMCKDHPNCFYKKALKQLTRLENQIVDLNKMVEAREQECEELKEDRERWKSNFNGKVSAIAKLLQQLDWLKQTLTEIKEIANYSFNRSTSEYIAKLELISEKISEVEDD